MKRFRSLLTSLLSASLTVALVTAPARSSTLKTIDVPSGGHVVYGPLAGTTSLNAGLGAVLLDVHMHFGDRPQIGRLFQTKGGDSVACFFTLVAKNDGGKKIAGLAIVTMPGGASPAAAVLYDDADRFGRSAPALMKRLDDAWRAAASRAGTSHAAPERAYPPAPLHEAGFADDSGSIGLPDGWQISSSGGGSAMIAGPNGESIVLGRIVQGIYDPNEPQARGVMRYLDLGHRPYYAYPFGGDLVQAWMNVARQAHARDNSPAPTFEETSRQTAPASAYEGYAVLVLGNLDLHDGKGPLRSRVRLGALRPTAGQWALTVERESLPPALVAKEWPTVVAMLQSYRQNGQEIFRQTQVVIDDIHARGRAATERAEAQSAANDEHNASVEAGWDQSAKYNESFENYTLDRAVIVNADSGEHGTLDNSAADSLVRSNPDRYQYVTTPNYLRGVDY